MSEEAQFIYDELRIEGYPVVIGKADFANILGVSPSTVDAYIKGRDDMPPHGRDGAHKNAKIIFSLKDVAEFVARNTVKLT